MIAGISFRCRMTTLRTPQEVRQAAIRAMPAANPALLAPRFLAQETVQRGPRRRLPRPHLRPGERSSYKNCPPTKVFGLW